MATKTWKLVDRSNNTFVDNLSIAADDLKGQASAQVRLLRTGLSDGLQVVELDSGAFRCLVLPGRGMGVWKGYCGEDEVGWQSPVAGPVHPKYVPISEPSGLGWLSGFDELLVRCGLESNGAPQFDPAGKLLYPLHGRIANLPAQRVELAIDGSSGELRLTGEVDESRFHFHKLRLRSTLSMRPGQRGFDVEDTITNIGGDRAEAQMLYHINFGAPVCLPGSKLLLAIDEMSPRDATAAARLEQWDTFADEEVNSAEQVYFCKLLANSEGWSTAMVRNADQTKGVSVSFDTATLPYFTVWKNTPMRADGYCVGLEPSTNFPNLRGHEAGQGRVVSLDADESVSLKLRVEFHATAEQVAEAAQQVAELQAAQQPTMHPQPKSGWCL